MADSGIDHDTCFFRTANDPLSPNATELDQRKIIHYSVQPDTDFMDGLEGHGTHVAGTVAGWSRGANNASDGMAPRAKLHFLDLKDTDESGFNVPDALEDDMLQPAFDDGARLHSNSWGNAFPAYPQLPPYATGQYGGHAHDVDDFMFHNPEMLVLFAAGNDGDVMASVSAPGVAKNILSVGATSNTNQSWVDNLGVSSLRQVAVAEREQMVASEDEDSLQVYYSPHALAPFSSKGPTVDGRFKPDLVAPGHKIKSAKSDGKLDGETCGTTLKVRVGFASFRQGPTLYIATVDVTGVRPAVWNEHGHAGSGRHTCAPAAAPRRSRGAVRAAKCVGYGHSRAAHADGSTGEGLGTRGRGPDLNIDGAGWRLGLCLAYRYSQSRAARAPLPTSGPATQGMHGTNSSRT